MIKTSNKSFGSFLLYILYEISMFFLEFIEKIVYDKYSSGRINMITKENLNETKKYVKDGYLLTIRTLKEFGFHIGEIAYLIETGILIDRKDGSYGYVGVKNEDTCTDNKDSSYTRDPDILLSILLREKNRIEIDTSDPDWNFLDGKSRILESKKGIIILKAMSEERRHKIYRFVKAIPCVIAFPIDKDSENKRVVLQFHIDNQVDINKLINLGNKAYHKRHFRESIKYYLEAFTHLRRPSSYLYGQLGLSYMKIGQTRNARNFLIVADSLNKAAGKNCKFADLIEDLKKKKGQTDDRKFYVPFEESEFQKSINEYYGLEPIEEMVAFVSSGKTIEEVQEKFSLTEEQVALLMLIFARNCYANGDFTLGDQYLRKVEKRKNKTEQIKQLLEEIRRKKKFYRNQVSEEVKPFLLTK